MAEESFPNELVRGISNNSEEFITKEGYPTQAAFKFDEYDSLSRDDGFCELSINWVDDEGAIDVLLNQINARKQVPQFQGGYCRFERILMEAQFKNFINSSYFSYERRPIKADTEKGIQENLYHGNILLKQDISKSLKTNIQCSLATLAGTVIKREQNK